MPVLNEGDVLHETLQRLQALRQRGVEIILADGGSRDGVTGSARALVDEVVHAPKGRALQMRCGVGAARAEVLWFLHADSWVPENADLAILSAVASGAAWGWFEVRLSGELPSLRLVEWSMNRRARFTRVATGDQGLYMTRSAYLRVDGFPDIALMEDVAMSKRLRASSGAPKVLTGPLITSSRRWEEEGVVRTVLLMWWLRLRYWLGADPARLQGVYYGRGK